MDLTEQWKAKIRFLKDNFSADQEEIAVSFFHGFNDFHYIQYTNYLLEGLGVGGEVESCSFPHPAEEDEIWDGVKFSFDMTWSDPNDYAENILEYDRFLELMQTSARWYLRFHPDDEKVLRAAFQGRNLPFGEEYPSIVDDGKAWWRKCRAKYDLTMQSHQFAAPNQMWSPIIDFFLWTFEQDYFDVLQNCFKRRPCKSAQMNVQIEFPSPRIAIIRETDERAGLNLRTQPEAVELTMPTFDSMLELLAKGYAERRPQHQAKIAKLLKSR